MAHPVRDCGLACIMLIVGSSSALQAAKTAVRNSPDRFDEPNLVGMNPFPDNPNPSVLETLYGEANLIRVDDAHDGLWMAQSDAQVKATARFSNNVFLTGILLGEGSERQIVPLFTIEGFGYDVDGSEYLSPAIQSTPFAFALRATSRNSVKLFSSLSLDNNQSRDRMVTFHIAGDEGHPQNQIGNYVLAWEDANDWDFQDAVLELSHVHPVVPEPAGFTLVSFFALPLLAYARHQRRTSVRSRRA